MTLATGFSGTVDGDPIDISVALSSYDQTSIVFVVTVNDVPIEDGQTVLLSYDADVGTITSTDGVALASFTDFPVTNASTVEIPHITASSVSANGSQVTFTFDRAVTGFSTTGFTITASGDPVTLYTAVLANDGLSGYLVVDAIYDDAVVAITHDEATTTTVSVASGTALRDYTTASATNNSTRQPPTVVSASASADGRHVDIRLSERVSGTPGTGWTLYDTTYARTVTIDSGVFTTNDVTDDGVRLTTSTTIYVDSLLTLAYSSASGDIVSFANPLVEMATFSGASVYVQSTQVPVRIVEADSFVAADGVSVTIGFNQSVSGTAGLGFSFTVDGVAAPFTGAAWADARTMTLTLTDGAIDNAVVLVMYEDGTGNIESGIREMFDVAGTNVTNNSTETVATLLLYDYGLVGDLSTLFVATNGTGPQPSPGEAIGTWDGENDLIHFYATTSDRAYLNALGTCITTIEIGTILRAADVPTKVPGEAFTIMFHCDRGSMLANTLVLEPYQSAGRYAELRARLTSGNGALYFYWESNDLQGTNNVNTPANDRVTLLFSVPNDGVTAATMYICASNGSYASVVEADAPRQMTLNDLMFWVPGDAGANLHGWGYRNGTTTPAQLVALNAFFLSH